MSKLLEMINEIPPRESSGSPHPSRYPTPIPSPLPSISNYRYDHANQVYQIGPLVPFFNEYVSYYTIQENPVYYNFMLGRFNLNNDTFDHAEDEFVNFFFYLTNNVQCDICYNQEIDNEFVYHCKGGYHRSCLKRWLRTSAICPHCHVECDSF